MKIVYVNPNATGSMTRAIVTTAQKALPEVEVLGLTNSGGPAAIEGPADGRAAVPGVLDCVARAGGLDADAIVIACFDDTGLAEARAAAGCPVLGIGQASYFMAALLGLRFSVVTSVAAAIPVIEDNIESQGFAARSASVRASGLPVLVIDEGAQGTIDHLAHEIETARVQDGAGCVILGCAGMTALKPELGQRAAIPLIDGVAASAVLARAAVAGLQSAS